MSDTKYREKFIEVNNVKLRYLDWGGQGKPPMICMHGHTGQAHIWDEFADVMSSYYHVYALDQRGHGGSDWAIDGYHRDRFVDDLSSFMDILDLTNTSLIGLSMGGWNALLYASHQSDRVQQIVIVDIAPERSAEARNQYVERPLTPTEFHTLEEVYSWARIRESFSTCWRFRKDVSARIRQRPDGKWIWKADPALLNSSLPDNQDPGYIARYWQSLRDITCPILEVRGTESILVSDDIIQRMKNANPKFSSVDVVGAGHVVPVDKPQEFIDATRSFLGIPNQ